MCGISGYVGNRPANIDKLKILGIYNVTRGSDSCGIVINDKVVKGVKDQANFTSFIESNTLTTHDSHKNYTVLIHTRNASNKSTKDDPECAHPFRIMNKKGKTLLIGAHNGVIYNEDELCKKYNVKEEKVDSKTLLSILAKVKTDNKFLDVLKDYEGAAALAWYTPDEPNTLNLWKGASKKYSTSDTFEEERPLFVYRPKDEKGKFLDEYYFSSIKESLLAIGADTGFDKNDVDKKPTLFSLEVNTLVTIKPGEKLKLRKIDRNTTTYVSTYDYNQTQGYNRSSTKPTKSTVNTGVKDTLMTTFVNYPVKKWKNTGLIQSNNKACIDSEPFIFDLPKNGNKVYFHKGRYWRNGHLVGAREMNKCEELELDIDGFPRGKMSCDTTSLDTYYFFQGFLLLSKESATAIEGLAESGRIWEDKKTKKLNLEVLRHHVYGFCGNFGEKYGTFKHLPPPGMFNVWANGDYIPMFDYDRVFTFNQGALVKAEYKEATKTQKWEIIKKFCKQEQTKVETSSVIVLPEKLKLTKDEEKVVNAVLNDSQRETILNHVADIQSSIKSTLNKVEPVKNENAEYSNLYNGLIGFRNYLSKKITAITTNDKKSVTTFTEEKSLLYS